MDQKNVPNFSNPPVLVLVLGYCTCGLYMIYWYYKTAEVLNAVAGREIISPIIAILSGLCFPLGIYYWYLAGQALEPLGQASGQDLKDKGTLLLILGIFVPPVSALILQGHMNEMFAKK